MTDSKLRALAERIVAITREPISGLPEEMTAYELAEIEAVLEEARNEAIEEAAVICEENSYDEPMCRPPGVFFAIEIRQLKTI